MSVVDEKGRDPKGGEDQLRPRHPLDSTILGRYRARVLRPENAVPAADGSPISPTVYRYQYLLVPTGPARTKFDQFRKEVEKSFELSLIEVKEDRLNSTFRIELPRGTTPTRPVDAWTILQGFKAAAIRADVGIAPGTPFEKTSLGMVSGMSLDHLFFGGTALLPPHYGIEGTPGQEGHGWGPARIPALLPANPPAGTPTGRVVAILDTDCWTAHPWLTGFVTRVLPPGATWEDPVTDYDLVEPLVGLTDSHSGHGTFIAGVIRQLAPNARIRVYPVMHSDGVVLQSDLVTQLAQISSEPAANKPDVILTSFGGYASGSSGITSLEPTFIALNKAGATLVASAGNDASAEEMYPAAFSDVIGVGALTRRGTAAIYSNEAPWVDTWFPGSSIVSTLPPFAGSKSPGLARPANPALPVLRPRQGSDPDDLSYKFGIWSGTSFAAAICAGLLARHLPAPGGPVIGAKDLAIQQVLDMGNNETWPP